MIRYDKRLLQEQHEALPSHKPFKAFFYLIGVAFMAVWGLTLLGLLL